MTVRLRVLIIVIFLAMIIYIFELMQQKKMDFRYGLGWILLGICILVLGIFPPVLTGLSALVGIASPVNMLFFFGLCFSIVIIFSLSRTISILSDKVKKLSQELAILRKDTYDQVQGISKKEDEKI